MSPKSFKKISHPELGISLYLSNFRKEVSQIMSERHAKNLELFGTSVGTSSECLQKISERYLIQNWRLILYLSNFRKEVSQITDIQEIQNDLKMVKIYPENVSKDSER